MDSISIEKIMAMQLLVNTMQKFNLSYHLGVTNRDFRKSLRHGGDEIVALWEDKGNSCRGKLGAIPAKNLYNILCEMGDELFGPLATPLTKFEIEQGRV